MKKLFLILSSLFVTIGLIVMFAGRVDSASPTFLQVDSTATATSTLKYMTPGTATSTDLVFDSYIYNGVGEIAGNLVFQLNMQFTGSSTASVLRADYEYSNNYNCAVAPSACDWYKVGVGNSTTATSTYITSDFEHLLVAASTTIGSATTKSSITPVTVKVPILMRYVRVVLSIPAGAANGGVWAEMIGIKSRQ